MKILIIPMFALSRMNGPWSRAQKIARAFLSAGHEVILGTAADGNCVNPVTPSTLELPVPAPLGAPMAIASRTFPLANKLGIAGRKPVSSYEEVLWLTGALAYRYEKDSVQAIRDLLRTEQPDVVYSEFSLPAIIAAEAEGIPRVGTASFPTQTSYACAAEKAGGVRRILDELGLPGVSSSLELFERMDTRFVPSCPTLEPFTSENVVFCGFLGQAPECPDAQRDAIVIYLGTGSVSPKALRETARGLAARTERDVYLAGVGEPTSDQGNLHIAERFNFSALLPRACAFVHHGGQNSTMDALAYGAPQVIFPGKVFERQYNAKSIAAAHAGIELGEFSANALAVAIERIAHDASLAQGAQALRRTLASLGGTQTIVDEVEKRLS